MPELIIVRGYPGVGKTTFSKALAKRNHFTFIDHNDILNNITKYTTNDDYMYRDIHNLELAMTKNYLKTESQSSYLEVSVRLATLLNT